MCLDVFVSLYNFKCNSLVNCSIGLKAFCAIDIVIDGTFVEEIR